MAKKERIEDLGVIAEKLRNILQKDPVIIMQEQSVEMFMEQLVDLDTRESLYYELKQLYNKLACVFNIANSGGCHYAEEKINESKKSYERI